MFICGKEMTDLEIDTLINYNFNSIQTKSITDQYKISKRMEAEERMKKEKNPKIKEQMRRHLILGNYNFDFLFGN